MAYPAPRYAVRSNFTTDGSFLEQAVAGRRGRSRDTSSLCRSRQFHSGVRRVRRRTAPEIAPGDYRGDAVGADAAHGRVRSAAKAVAQAPALTPSAPA